MEESLTAVEAVVEIPRGSRNKYEFDHATGSIRLDRVLFSSVHRKPRWIPASLLAGGKRLAIRRGEYVCQGTVAGDIKMTWV